MERMKEKCNWRGIGSLVVITVCLVSVMSPALTQSSFPLFNNESNTTDGEIPEPAPSPSPTLTPNPPPTIPTPTQSPSPSPSSSPTPTPTPSPTPTPGPTPTLTPTPSPSPAPSPTLTPTPSPPAPNITFFTPDSPVYDAEGETRTFNITTDQVVNVSWLFNGTEVQTNESVTEASYTNTSPAVGTWNVPAVATNENGTAMQTWLWNVSQQATPAPTLGPTPSPSPLTTPTLTPTPSPSPTPALIQSLASNITPLTPFYIYGYVAHENGTQCYAPLVVVTILNISSNTSEEFIAGNHTKSHFYQVITNSAHVKAGDVLQIEASKNGASVGNATYNVTHADIHRGVIAVNINGGSPDLTDLEVTDIDIPCIFNPCFKGHAVPINVTITNIGAIDATDFTVYLKEGIGEENTSGSVFFNETFPGLNSGENVSIHVNWTPKEYAWYTITASIDNADDNNKANNEMYKEVPVYAEFEFAVENVSVHPNGVGEGENVTINATIRNLGIENGSVDVSFYVNSTDFVGSSDERFIEIGRAEIPIYVEVNKTNSTSIPWKVDVTGGDHLIYAVVNPDNNLTEWPQLTHRLGKSIILKNQTLAGNNVKNCTLQVITPDLNITKLTLDPPKPVEGDLVNVTADVRNEGTEKANSTVWFYMEEEGEGLLESGTKWSPYVVSSLSRPENMTIRVHFDYITISNGWTSTGGFGYWGYDDVFCADMDGQPRDFYVRSDDVVDGQPIKVAEIDFNTSCGECRDYNMHEGELYCTCKRWENVWTEWSNGKNLELKVSPQNKYTMGIFVDKYQVRLGNRTITLNAGECMPYTVTWNTSSLETGENYTLVANVEDKVERNETFLRTTDLAMTNLSVEKEVLDGNQSWINVTIENVGRKNATAFLINFTEIYVPTGGPPGYGVTVNERDNNYTLFNSTNITTGLGAGNITNISMPWNASIRNILCEGECQKGGVPYSPCKWNETAENYTIKVEINPLDNIEVEENNDKEENVHVKRSRDFSVTNLSFTVDNEARVPDYGKVNFELGENVTLNATFNITNLANRGDTVTVGFYIDEIDTEHEIGNLGINFSVNEINETKSVKLENWTVWNFSEVNIAGDHNMTVVVDPENKIIEFDDSNNEYTQRIHVKAPEFTVTNISFNPELPKAGDNVTINVTIANYGDKNATNVALAIYDWANRRIENVAGLEEYSGFPSIEVKRENATAMRLYLDLDIEGGGEVCIQNSKGELINSYNDSFHGWTPWFLDNNITVVTNGDAYAKVSKVYYLEESSEIDRRTIPAIECNKTANTTVNWTAPPVGERLIVAIINPDINIPEYNESNNTLTSYVSVQTADLIISNLALQFNDTKIKHDDVVTITANVTNAGVDNAPDFDVRFFVDDILIPDGKKIIPNLANGSTKPLVANWTAIVGKHVIKVEADYENKINETNETNNIEAHEIYVYGAEVSGNESWESLGLHGEILFDNKTQLYDEDGVNITVNITNFGCLDATNFNVLLFYDYSPDRWEHRVLRPTPEKWLNETQGYGHYPGAGRVYLQIIDRAKKDNWPVGTSPEEDCDHIDAGDIEIYDAWGNAVLNETNFNSTCNWTQVMEGKSCWIPVLGDTTNVSVQGEKYETFTVSFFPVYENETSRLFEGINVPVNSSHNVSMNRNVSVGSFTVMAVIDPENRVPEDDKNDNIITREIEVEPAKDFTVMNIIPETRTNLSDDDVIHITANVSNVGYRNGTTKVRFVDYETESGIHKYYFNRSLNLSEYNLPYLPTSPNETILQPYRDLVIIHRPDVDAIHLNYSWELYKGFTESSQWIPHGEIWICNETGELWRASYGDETKPEPMDWVQGDTAYIRTINAKFDLGGYTTKKEFHEEENVRLNASVTWNKTTKNITAMWSEAKDITTRWTASPGDHNVTVIIDPDDEISEMNETNNTYVLVPSLSVNATKDPEIMDLKMSPRHPRNGDSVIITAVVHNNGTANANFMVDLWMDTLKDSSAAPVPNDWNITVGGKTRYITLLNHTELSLAPGERANVTALWENISVYGNPIYVVRAIVAPLDKIDEINESNNEMSTEIIMNYPDLTVAGFNSPTNEEKNASVTIKNIGGDDASNATVMLELTRHKLVGYTGITDMNETRLDITEKDASRIRVHFDKLDVTTDEDAFLVIKDKDGEKVKEGYYSGKAFEPFWSPWVKGDTILIYYCGADFYIDECEWGDAYTTTINLSASESVDVWPPKNGTYKSWNRYDGLAFLNATVDPYDEVIEQREDNNNKNATIYVDLVPKEIKIEGNTIKPVIWSDDTVENGMAFNTSRNFTISLEAEYNSSYETIMTKPFEETIYGGEERDDVWFDIYDCLDKFHFKANNKSKIRVKVDSKDEIEELNDGNNEKEMEIGPDIEIEDINVWPEYAVEGRHNCSINVILRNKGCLPAEGFYVNCSSNISYLNEGGGIESEEVILPQKEFSLDLNGTENGTRILTFEWDPPGNYTEHLPYYDVSEIKVVADTNNIVDELDETNNEGIRDDAWRIYTETGYDANYPLETKYHDEMVNCNVSYYKTGDDFYLASYKLRKDDLEKLVDFNSTYSHYGPTDFNNVIPEGATVKHARLYLYWTWGYVEVDDPLCPGETKPSPAPLNVGVTFNDRTFNKPDPDGNHVDLPTATEWDVAWGTYAYDVTNITGKDNTVGATRKLPENIENVTGFICVPAVAGMGLLVIYERDDLPLTTYWINEGADVLWMIGPTTGLTPEDCTTKARFKGKADLDRVNATLRTIVPFGDTVNNRLFFNSGQWDGIWQHGTITWPPGMDNRYVTDYLISQDNEARLQDRGDGGGMMPSNAFLILRYPPDLEPFLNRDTAEMGGKYPVIIRNDGRSRSSGFDVNVNFSRGGLSHEYSRNISSLDANGAEEILEVSLPKWALVGQTITITAEVNYTKSELTKENNIKTKNVTIVEGPIIPPKHPGGGGGGIGEGWGEGTGTGEGGAGDEGAEAIAGGGEGAVGESGGKAITGYLMKGIVATSEEEGGGKGEFSLVALLMRLMMLAAAGSLVCAGYLLERRRQNNKLSLEKKV